MTLTLRDSMRRISDPENLDASVREVFETMLAAKCNREPVAAAPAGCQAPESVTAVVGFGGILSGAYVIRCDARSACQVAARMTGMGFETVDETVKDAVGEICNMLAGAWKSGVPELASHCGLSVPAVITGHDYNLHLQAPRFRICHAYSFDDYRFEITIICDGLK